MMEIARAAAQAFGVEVVELQPLGSSDNTAFRVRSDAEYFVLRLHNQSGRSLEEIRSELELLAWLSARGLRVQQPVIAWPMELEGRRWSLLSWLSGEVLEGFNPDQAARAGASLARLHNELAAFKINNPAASGRGIGRLDQDVSRKRLGMNPPQKRNQA